ncbi:type IIA topoisomerase, A subunit [Longilinea arvoryzae]|uniref:Type IIA topoisomerase, A subunit n=1 Tax=Longilinea arvoryzae TaxID=360412 RepID=A0A0S7BK22_9CHLR|nr:DNA gyrase C-terminal beta-propeller domain-containing protein [Longilinea arvoryzae]GAP14680.1 type IIA topoisomerase, A subunit [Longilinea arvoryzae]
MERPDLTNIRTDVLAYIESLEARIAFLEGKRSRVTIHEEEPEIHHETALPEEKPTTDSLISLSANGKIKRTQRHLYSRQHRSGMGVFDLDIDLPDLPAALQVCPESTSLLLFTNLARVFRLPVGKMDAREVRAKGEDLTIRFPLEEGERYVAVLPDRASGFVALASERGRIRILRHHLFGEHMRPGTAMFKPEEFGQLTTVCWSPGSLDLLLLSRRGMGIRFSEKLVNPQGDLGLRLAEGDSLVAVLSVSEESSVFIAGADGRGTVRKMSSFAPNKSTGGSGKIAMRSDQIAGALVVDPNDDIFMASRLAKVIRFPVNEVPETDGVVQGVVCMQLRADDVVALSTSKALS